MRTFKFKLLTSNVLFPLETEARTMRDLRTEIRSNRELMQKFDVNPSSDLSELNLIDRSSRTSYQLDDAVLPQTDTIFFVSFTKSKGGGYVPGMNEDLDELTKSDLMELADLLNEEYGGKIDTAGVTKEELIYDLLEYYSTTGKDLADDTPEGEDFFELNLSEKLILCAAIITNVADKIIEQGPGPEVVSGVTREQLEQESVAIYGTLKRMGLAQ